MASQNKKLISMKNLLSLAWVTREKKQSDNRIIKFYDGILESVKQSIDYSEDIS
jgi:hypothetical protein